MFKTRGGGSKAVRTMLKKTALLVKGGFPYPLPSICELATKIHILALMFGWMPKAQVEPKTSII